ncbi:DNA recombination and repair protein RecF [Fulvivirga imtechensis AK7]|uniref:DNA replication and repair protein RecF n=1 Tax=Fulvivirga imtechensis AK7 TaxID=1237149 RepID=L8JQE1_9BACT|nr:DNA replication and repair protein RecF [Fulvivirga imtechensis]ELR69689.1 DNA recombination and repair protein RecF [Fulvivirga imtechensis AK7]
MHIEKLSLFNFKNYEDVTLNFSEKVNCLVGVNGSGKTNILDAIYYLSLTKSAFNNIDSQNIRFGESIFSIKGNFKLENKTYEIVCAFQEGSKKTFKANKKDYEKLSEHVGRFPVVLIAPNDVDVIREGSEARRKFFDTILCQLDSSYLETLSKYNQYLRQRNSALKKFAFIGRVDYDLINTYDDQLLKLGKDIFLKRAAFIRGFLMLFQQHYIQISQGKEEVNIIYRSEWLQDDFVAQFKASIKKDLALERTSMGIHRDDYRLIISGKPIKKFASQGQQKTYLVALKMAHFDTIAGLKDFKPILLLDDIFDKLDDERIRKLMEMITGHQFGQVFITDARRDRTEQLLATFNLPAQIITLPLAK